MAEVSGDVRSICLTHQDTLLFEFPSTIAGPAAITLGDADNDGGIELVVGGLDGTLAVFKGWQEQPAYVASGLGGIVAVGLGRLFLATGDAKAAPRQLVVIAAEGRCHIFNIIPDATVGLGLGPAPAAAAGLDAGSGDAAPAPVQVHPIFTLSCPCNVTACTVGDVLCGPEGGSGHPEFVVGTSDGHVHVLGLEFDESPNYAAPATSSGGSGGGGDGGDGERGGDGGGADEGVGGDSDKALLRELSAGSFESWHSTTATPRLAPLHEYLMASPVISVAFLDGLPSAAALSSPVTERAAAEAALPLLPRPPWPDAVTPPRKAVLPPPPRQQPATYLAVGLGAGSFEILPVDRKPVQVPWDSEAIETETETEDKAAAAGSSDEVASDASEDSDASGGGDDGRDANDGSGGHAVGVDDGGGMPLSLWGWSGGAQIVAMPDVFHAARGGGGGGGGNVDVGSRQFAEHAADTAETVSARFAVCTLDGRVGSCAMRRTWDGPRWRTEWCRQTCEPFFSVGTLHYGPGSAGGEGVGGGGSRRGTAGGGGRNAVDGRKSGGGRGGGSSDSSSDAEEEELIAACAWSGRTYLWGRSGERAAVFDPSDFLSHPVRAFACGALTVEPGRTEPCLCYVSGGVDGLGSGGGSDTAEGDIGGGDTSGINGDGGGSCGSGSGHGGEIVVYCNIWRQIGPATAAPLSFAKCLLEAGVAEKLERLLAAGISGLGREEGAAHLPKSDSGADDSRPETGGDAATTDGVEEASTVTLAAGGRLARRHRWAQVFALLLAPADCGELIDDSRGLLLELAEAASKELEAWGSCGEAGRGVLQPYPLLRRMVSRLLDE
ncbi:unnamed protein product [Phaeothamnion confervicola]